LCNWTVARHLLKPLALGAADGHAPDRKDTTMSKPEAPQAPRHLSAEARALWRSLHDRYEFEDHEEHTLRMAVESLDRASAARRALKRHGTVYLDRFDAPHARPEVAIERDARASWLRLMGALDLPAEEEAPAEQGRTIRGRFGEKTPRGSGRVARAKAAGDG
jgi:phage terminase small subunit